MKIILVPDDGREYVLVPKVATDEMVEAVRTHSFADRCLDGDIQSALGSAFAAAPPCKVVELPAAPAHLEHNEVKVWYACLDEIERRAK